MLKPLIISCILLLLASHGQALQILVDETNSISIDSIMPTLIVQTDEPLSTYQHSQFSTEHYQDSIKPSQNGSWYKMTFKSNFHNSQPQRRTIVVGNHILRHLNFYLYDGSTLIKQEQLGIIDPDNIIRSSNIDEYQGPTFEFYIENNQPLTLLIYKQNNGPSVLPMTLYNDEGLMEAQRDLNFFWGGIICVLLVMAMYNIIVYALHPNKAYLWYMGFHSLMIFYFGGLNGFGYLLFPIDLQVWLSQNIMSMNFLIIFVVINFASVFLDIKNNAPKFLIFVKPIGYASIIGAIISLWTPEYYTIPVFSVLQVSGSIFGISVSIISYRNNYKPAKYFLASWAFTIMGAGVGMGAAIGQLPANFFTLHGFLFGTLSELFLFSVALAHRMKSIEVNMLTQSYIYPDTKIGNFSFLKNILPEQISDIKVEHHQLVLIVAEIHGLKELVSLYGPQALSDYYQTQTGLISEYIEQQPWSVPMTLPSNEKIFLIGLPGEQIFLMANIEKDKKKTTKSSQVEDVMETIMKMASEHSEVTYHNVKISFVTGCNILDNNVNFSENFRQTQVALLSALNIGKKWELYTSEQDKKIIEQVTMVGDIELALKNRSMEIYIQPQYSLMNQALNGGEILLRWNDAKRGFVTPDVFIPLAEKSGLVFKITKFVIEETFQWLNKLKKNHPEFYSTFEVSINLSALDMAQTQLVSHLQNCIFYYGIDSSKVILEVTESAVLNNADLFLDTIRKLKLLGFRISIDDFGTGYSSMQYLQTMKADEIKIDMSFIRNIHSNLTSQNIAKAIIQLAHSTGAKTVAEGIQTEQEMNCLLDLRCVKAQGYYWSPAIPTLQFEKENIH